MKNVIKDKLVKPVLVTIINLFVIFGSGISQNHSVTDLANTKKIIPASPNASSLKEYSKIDVNMFSGTPTITVPLYTINIQDFELPIFLNYNASGIKVEQLSSWIGLAFSLNCGGQISRSIRGLEDEIINNGYLSDAGETVDILRNKSDTEIDVNDVIDLYHFATGLKDGEPDIYNFNIAGRSGKFIFDKDGNIHLIPRQDIKIEYTQITEGTRKPIIEFVLTIEDGTKFIFDVIETTKPIPQTREITETDYISDYTNDAPWAFNITNFNKMEYNSTWHLSQIILPNSTEIINFSYEPETLFYFLNLNEIYGYKIEDLAVGHGTERLTRIANNHIVNGKRLSGITWSGGNIDFIPGNEAREDINDEVSDDRKGHYLKEINIYNQHNINIKNFIFEHSYFMPSLTNNLYFQYQYHPSYFKRLRLDKIYEESNGETNPPFIFVYNPKSLPPRISAEKDFWGYFKNNNAKIAKPNIYVYPEDSDNEIYNSIYSIYKRPGVTLEYYINDGVSRTPDADDMQACILKKIIYPTGGHTEFIFEPHDFMLGQEKKTGGGLRLKETIFYDGLDSEKALKKSYHYHFLDNSDMSSGKFTRIPSFSKINYQANIGIAAGTSGEEYYKLTLSRNCNDQVGVGHDHRITYSEVIVETDGIGRTVYNYENPVYYDDGYSYLQANKRLPAVHSDLYTFWGQPYASFINMPEHQDNFPFLPDPDYSWSRGHITSEYVYDNENRLVYKKEYEYDYGDWLEAVYVPAISANVFNYEEAVFMIIQYYDDQGIVVHEPVTLKDIRWGHFDYVSDFKYLKKVIETKYDPENNNNYVTKVATYDRGGPYAHHHQLWRSTETKSDGSKICTIYKYPGSFEYDFTWSNLNKNVIQEMDQNHIVNKIIAKLQMIQNGNDFEIVTGYLHDFAEFYPDKYFQSRQLIYETDTKIPITWEEMIQGTFINDNHFKEKSIFDKYDQNGNILQYHKINNQPISYLWGYNSLLVNAQATNANWKEIAYTSYEENIGSNHVTDSRSGDYGYRVNPNGYSPSEQLIWTQDQSGKYISSAWVKTENGFNSGLGSCHLVTSIFDNSTNNQIYWSSTSTGSTNNEWKYLEKELDFDIIKNNNPVVTEFKFKCYIWNANSAHYIITDDMRMQPENAQMVTYTYDPLIGISSESDLNNMISYYEYDDLKRLECIRDMDNNIIEKYDYNFMTPVIIDPPDPCENIDPINLIDFYLNFSSCMIIVHFNQDIPENMPPSLDIELIKNGNILGGIYGYQPIYYPQSNYYQFGWSPDMPEAPFTIKLTISNECDQVLNEELIITEDCE